MNPCGRGIEKWAERFLSAKPGRPEMILRLYIAGEAPNSVQAMANLEAICREYLSMAGPYKIEIIDVLKEPQRALKEGILVTPTLVKLSPPPACKIVGNLSEKAKVLLALGLER